MKRGAMTQDDQASQRVLDFLAEKGVGCRIEHHPAVYTIEEMEALNLNRAEEVAKNLFLRDDKKLNYYLLVMRKDKKADLKKFRSLLTARPLKFASEDDLEKHLGLTKGAVTPFGLLNDSGRAVKVVLDNDLLKSECIAVHPNSNLATVWLAVGDLIAVIQGLGHELIFVDL